MLSYVPVQGLFDSAPWTVALSRGFGIFLIYRATVAVARAVFGGDIFDVPREAADKLLQVTVSSARAITVFAIAADSVSTISYREDVHALSMTLLRLSITLLSLRVLAATGHIARLMPAEGNPQYLRFRSIFVRYLPHFLAFSVLLLALWTLGFNRAATTVLVRSYSIIGMLVVGALSLRWFDRYTQRPNPDSALHALVDQVDSFARFCINIAFAAAILSLIGLLDPLRQLLDNVGVTVGESQLTALNIIRGLSIIGGAVLVSRVTRVLLEWWFYPRFGVDVGAAYATNTAVHYFVIALASGLALVSLGIDLAALAVFAGALGVGIGFGLQDFAKNMISGLVLLFGRVIEKGDLVTINETYIGNVEQIGGRMVRIRTRDNTDMVIPASEVVGSTLVNWTHGDPHVRLHIPVGVSYDADVHEVREALLAAAAAFSGARTNPAPAVWLVEFGDSSINFELLLWVDAVAVDPREARGRIMFHIWDALLERDIEIPFPQRDLHIRSVDPDALRLARGEGEGEGGGE
jgi:small-conductance mechanosensitive channel